MPLKGSSQTRDLAPAGLTPAGLAMAKSAPIEYFPGMSKLEEIQAAIGTLSLEEQERLRAWLEELGAQRFDAAIERDAAAGKLDELMERAHQCQGKAPANAISRRPHRHYFVERASVLQVGK